MAEESMAAYVVTAGVAISLAIVYFVLRGKGYSDGSHNHDKVTTNDSHVN